MSAAGQEAGPAGHRQFADLGDLPLELGGVLPGLTVAYETWGTPAPDRTNAVLVLHALTGDSHVAGPAGEGHPTPGWWDAVVGPGKPLDTDRWWVVAPNVLGGCRGTTGPASRRSDGSVWGSRFPRTTIRDQVAAEALLADALGIGRWAAVLGGSMGGMRSLEWAVSRPERVGAALVLAVGAATSADQVALGSVQRRAIAVDPAWQSGDYHDTGTRPEHGLALARQIAHLTYRSEQELALRFGRSPQGDEDPLLGGRFAVESYLQHHGSKLVGRFDAASYVALTSAMDTHDVGRGRGGVARALSQVPVPTVVGGVDSDRLYPLAQQEEIARLLPHADGLHVVTSPYGHDAFLIEAEQVGRLVERTLSHARTSGASGRMGVDGGQRVESRGQ
ncbi:homoserine O-acetyltransferase [Motilibacter peucedani]|uniref:Homoserine O-acetyltransferase n=1 Tax=Motilibacter peucedani TaxID=598650 RepID=A0A420XVC6_9ACTN|nr:homoserine O-acetyltransferase [Motilibacter peucedani]RKS80681.1 homoserine O-acetyltransferase [Motilibacter peucedani]